MKRTCLTVFMALGLAHATPGGEPPPPRGGPWSLGLAFQGADFSGHYFYQDGQKTTAYDTTRDLGLGKSNTGMGLGLDYEGSRFRVHLATWRQDYAGDRNVAQDVSIDGQVYRAGARVQSGIKLRDHELDWTVKVLRWEEGYLGVDLGLSVWRIEVAAQGQGSVSGGPVQFASATAAGTQAIPQAGLSAGYRLGPWVEARGYFHVLSRSGANYRRAGADLRYFPVQWLGIRLNVEREGFDVPKGSLDSNTALKIDKNGAGLGVVWRF
jgi:hypothetical protein